MKINITTRVDKNYLEVKEGFTEKLFLKLSPPFPPVKLLRFDGSSKGDLVSLELNFLVFKQKWTSEITADHTDGDEFYFIDEGIELPFFLKKWRHKHRIQKAGSGSLIKDEIEYEGKFGLMTVLLFPALYGQFLYRKPIYKKYFQLK
ncbi:SRPBCC family protein [Shivajiella indica]|uniref:Ligand-binding SRPBCC domain-containing protein n=1 Tax=Shivajiella indica TaxID=872115 RepID=A0ABW5BG74_9BACT